MNQEYTVAMLTRTTPGADANGTQDTPLSQEAGPSTGGQRAPPAGLIEAEPAAQAGPAVTQPPPRKVLYAGYTVRAYSRAAALIVDGGRLLDACNNIEASILSLNSLENSGYVYKHWQVVIVDDSANPDVMWTIVHRFLEGNQRFKDHVQFVHMAKPSPEGAGSAARAGEQFKPAEDPGMVACKNNLGFLAHKARCDELNIAVDGTNGEAFICSLDDDDATSAEGFHTPLLGACAKNFVADNLIIATMRCKELLLLVPEGRTRGSRAHLEILNAGNMHSCFGTGASAHMPLSIILKKGREVWVPAFNVMEDIRHIHMVCRAFGCDDYSMVWEIQCSGYLERVGVCTVAGDGHLWAGGKSVMDHLLRTTLCEKHAERIEYWTKVSPCFMHNNLAIAGGGTVQHGRNPRTHAHDLAALYSQTVARLGPLETAPATVFVLWDQNRQNIISNTQGAVVQWRALNIDPHLGVGNVFKPGRMRVHLSNLAAEYPANTEHIVLIDNGRSMWQEKGEGANRGGLRTCLSTDKSIELLGRAAAGELPSSSTLVAGISGRALSPNRCLLKTLASYLELQKLAGCLNQLTWACSLTAVASFGRPFTLSLMPLRTSQGPRLKQLAAQLRRSLLRQP